MPMNQASEVTDGEEMEMLLAELRWSHRGLAEILDVRFESVVRWLDGRYNVPPALLAWLRVLAEFHRLYPLPEGWETGARSAPQTDRADEPPRRERSPTP
jgi:hypothetical protein